MKLNKLLSILFMTVAMWTGVIDAKGVASIPALKKEEAKEAVRDNVASRSFSEIENTKSDRFTQTEAHLYLKPIRTLIEKNYPDTERYLDVVATVIANEAEHKDTHYAFYNTTPNAWRLAQDLYTRLHAYEHPELATKEFKFLRFNDESVNETPQGFLVNELKEKGLVDDNTDTKFIMLSVNLSLFGNVGFPGECSWEYFVKPQGHVEPIRAIYVNMMKRFGLTDKYIDELMALTKIYDTKEDTIIQILVPIEKIDSIGYLAWVKGIPAHGETMKWVMGHAKSKGFTHGIKPTMEKLTEEFAKKQEKNPMFVHMLKAIQKGDFSLETFLKVYRNEPWKVDEINDVTARLLFTPDVLLNPKSGVKFFRFSTVTNDKLREYNHKLNNIISKMIAEKGSQGAGKATNVPKKAGAAASAK